jgi:hypothetical protein
MVTIEEVRAVALRLPRSYEALVRDQVRFRVGRIVYLGFGRDETVMGFACPKAERQGLVTAEPDKFLLPDTANMRYNWAAVHLGAIDQVELRELVIEAWTMVVPKGVATAYFESLGSERTGSGY